MFSGCNFLIFFFRYQGKCKSCATIFFIFAKYNIVYTNWNNMNPRMGAYESGLFEHLIIFEISRTAS